MSSSHCFVMSVILVGSHNGLRSTTFSQIRVSQSSFNAIFNRQSSIKLGPQLAKNGAASLLSFFLQIRNAPAEKCTTNGGTGLATIDAHWLCLLAVHRDRQSIVTGRLRIALVPRRTDFTRSIVRATKTQLDTTFEIDTISPDWWQVVAKPAWKVRFQLTPVANPAATSWAWRP